MDVTLTSLAKSPLWPGETPATPVVAPKQGGRASQGVTVETATARPLGEPDAVELPEGDLALTRDDDLGRLLNRAFSLEAPPMPNFPEIGGQASL